MDGLCDWQQHRITAALAALAATITAITAATAAAATAATTITIGAGIRRLHRYLGLLVLRAVQRRAMRHHRLWQLCAPALALALMRRAHTHPAAPRRTARPVVLCVRERERPRATKPFTCVVWG